MESYPPEYTKFVQQKMAQALHLLANSGAWWYSLYGLQNDDSSLANLLGIDDAILPMIYDCCGWSHTYSKGVGNRPRFCIGIGNGLLKFFLDFVDTRIENIPASLCKLRTKVTELQVELEDYVEGDYEVWIHEGGAELASLMFERSTATELAKERDEDGKFVLSTVERKEVKAYVEQLKLKMKPFDDAKSVFTDKISELKAAISKTKALAKSEEKKLGGGSIKATRRALESILKEYNIDRGAHHGGDLVGGGCRNLMKFAAKIFADIELELLKIPESERYAGDQEVGDTCSGMVAALEQFDALFSLLRMENGTVEDCHVEWARIHAKRALACWRQLQLSVSMKAHLLEGHAVEQMKKHKGIGDFGEDYVEQGHQIGGKEERRTNGLKDRAKAAKSHSKWETMRAHPLVVKEVAAVALSVKRPLRVDEEGRTAKMARDKTSKMTREGRREQIRADDYVVEGLPSKFMTNEQQAKLDLRIATTVIADDSE